MLQAKQTISLIRLLLWAVAAGIIGAIVTCRCRADA